ncbi:MULTISPECIES: malto-oligosyltrehalose trehalohydrolase [Sphingobacterium]|uniref:malto-oligosyltrehalose trehalohydrolase n=1 Tax=Sphingobacterium TaxID=28453 RepID=UPI00257BB94D|nr:MULTISPECIES: malto-oligosyltrehalose trehalohydrolase [Sphingobacterium]
MSKTGIRQLGVQYNGALWEIRVWAPNAKNVYCMLYNMGVEIPLEQQAYGYWYAESDLIRAGDLYRIRLDDNEFPDPLSRSQPEGVHGPSQAVDLAFSWTDQDYQPPQQSDFIIYELHVGTFSSSHDFDGVIKKIPYLKNLGITAIEIMPVAQFPGERNWGYDGVFPFAVQHSYGGASELQRLVNACHEAGIAVILDVVYNHVGPEGNYFAQYGAYFTEKYRTPWGDALNYDDRFCHGQRDLVVNNVQMWFEDFHIDALRMDAVHAIKDFSPIHILQEIRAETDNVIAKSGKNRYLFVECDLNDRRFLDPLVKNGFAMDAQWLDEFHHALRVAIGEPKKGYYQEFNGVEDLAKAYEKAYVFDGNYSFHREKFFGTDTTGIPGDRFIVFSQNHDQVGNRMLGDRAASLYAREITCLMTFAVFMSPYLPLLFMGEEWGTARPFPYFISHSDPELVELVREGRKREFEDFLTDHEVPDPQDETIFRQAVLDWDELNRLPYQQQLSYYKSLIAFRKSNPLLKNMQRSDIRTECLCDKKVLSIYVEQKERQMIILMNFSAHLQHVNLPAAVQWTLSFDTNVPDADLLAETDAVAVQDCSLLPWSGYAYTSK